MNEQETLLLQNALLYVTELFETRVGPGFHFHNIQHVQQVVNASQEMAGYYKLNDEDHLALMLAAWFHDTGYASGSAVNHENVSVNIAQAFLNQQQTTETVINKVIACIRATKMPQQPANLVEQIICDADLYHLGTPEAKEKSKALRQEIEFAKGLQVSKKDWAKTNIYFMEHHHYFTDYCRQRLEHVKQEYINKLRKKYNLGDETITLPGNLSGHAEHEKQPVGNTAAEAVPSPETKPKKDKQVVRPLRPERGIETMFRSTSSNNFRLSSMADSKAHILITVNSIVLSIVASRLLEKLKNFPHFIIPTILLTLVCLAAITFSVLATRPNISKGRFNREDIENKKTNLLFFGNFHRMSVEEYEWAMKEMMKDGEYLYGSMIRDIYFLGVVLAKKYRYLHIAYNIFMYGLISAMLAFVVASFLAPA